MSEQYQEERAKEIYELKLGTMDMKELNSKFLSLLHYVPYIVDENPKVQRFLSCLPFHIKERVEYDNPKTLEEAIQKENFFYEENHKKESMSNQKAKRSNNFEQKKKGFISNHNFRNNNTCNFPNKNFQGNKGNSQVNSNGPRNKEPVNNHNNYTKNNERKEPVKCWNVMVLIIHQFPPTGRRLLAIYIRCRRR